MDPKYELSVTSKKSEDFFDWYTQAITKSKLILYSDISGIYILLPTAQNIWENIQAYLNIQLKKQDIQNAYFPLLITKKNLELEKNHIAGFFPEVAWVTHAGSSELSEKLAIRPTSEVAIYSVLPNLIRNYTDLPLKLNQWCSVVRWEFKDPIPFIRSREFNWSETHTAHRTESEANSEIQIAINIYRDIYKNLMAVPVISGFKTEFEKFAGADRTATLETFIPEPGKAIQAATAHNLGQNFSKIFNIKYQDINNQNLLVWQNSWGITTRAIGITIMTHGDDKGIIIPPNLAPVQIIIIPILIKNKYQEIINYTNNIYDKIKNNFRVQLDNRQHTPGWKFNYWETMGVPLRIEIGLQEIAANQINLIKRNSHQKITLDINSDLNSELSNILKNIQAELYISAETKLYNNITKPNSLSEFESNLNNKKMVLIKWCNTDDCHQNIKNKYHAKSLCIPDEIPEIANLNCLVCNNPGKITVLFGRSF